MHRCMMIRHEIAEFVPFMIVQTINANTQMLQRAWAALPLSMIRERASEGTFFSVVLIAMAGWVYFITLSLGRLIQWFLS